MMISRRHFVLSLGFLALGSTAASAGPLAKLREKIKERRAAKSSSLTKPVTVSYGPALLDIYSPANASQLPVMIFIHGGGWKHGDRTYVQDKPDCFVKNGYIFVSIDYRMLPGVDVATEAKDVEAAYAFVRQNIAQYGGDPAKIVMMGHSAGCHLLALAMMRGGLPGVRGVVLNDSGGYKVSDLATNGKMRGLYKEPFADPSQWDALSPVTYLNSGPHPATLIAYSHVKLHQKTSKRFAAQLKATGTRVELFDGTAYSHAEINRGFGGSAADFTAATLAFLKTVLE
jgi:acetyl esterase/lipase